MYESEETVIFCFTNSYSGQILQQRSLREYLKAVVIADAKNFQDVNEFCQRNSYFFNKSEDGIDVDASMFGGNSDIVNISAIFDTFSEVPGSKWDQGNLTTKMHEICEKLAMKPGNDESDDAKAVALRTCKRLVQLNLRAAIARGRHGPGIIQTMLLIGRETCLKRLLQFNSMVKGASP